MPVGQIRQKSRNGFVYLYSAGIDIVDDEGRRLDQALVKVGMSGVPPGEIYTDEELWISLMGNMRRHRTILRCVNPEAKIPCGSAHSKKIVFRSWESQKERLTTGNQPIQGRPPKDCASFKDMSTLRLSMSEGRFRDFAGCVRSQDRCLELELQTRQTLGTILSVEQMIYIAGGRKDSGLSEFVIAPANIVLRLREYFIEGILDVELLQTAIREERNKLLLSKPQSVTFQCHQETKTLENVILWTVPV